MRKETGNQRGLVGLPRLPWGHLTFRGREPFHSWWGVDTKYQVYQQLYTYWAHTACQALFEMLYITSWNLVTIPHGINAILTISQMGKPGSRTAYILIVVLNWGKHQNHLWSFKNRCPRKRCRNPAKSPNPCIFIKVLEVEPAVVIWIISFPPFIQRLISFLWYKASTTGVSKSVGHSNLMLTQYC